jgi:hypothetical protein
MDNKKLTAVILFLLTVGLAGYSVTHPGSFVPVLMAAAVAGMLLISHPKLLLPLLFFGGAAKLRLLGVGERLSFQEALFVVSIGYGILHRALAHRSSERMDLSDKGLFIFGLTLIMLMGVRGFGLSIMRSGSFGGRDYIVLFLAMMAYKALQDIRLSARQTRKLVVWFAVASLVPLASQVLISSYSGLQPVLEKVIQTESGYLFTEGAAVGGEMMVSEQSRLQGAGAGASALWFIVVAALWNTPRRWIFYGALGATLLVTLQGGFRGAAVTRVILSCIVLVATSRRRWNTAITLTGLAVVGYLLLMIIGPQLPFAIQRSLSFLPGINWDVAMVKQSAGTLTWRFEVWKICWANLPQHLLVGRGLLLDNVMAHSWRSASYYNTPEFFYAAHGYHSGPLGLLLDTGIPGLIGFFMFQVGIASNAFRYFRESAGSTNLFLRGYMLALKISTAYSIFSYYFIFGDIKETLPKLLITGILIRVVGEALLKEKAEAAVAAEVTGEAEVGGRRSEVSPTTQQLVTGGKMPVNRWARPGAARG